MDSKTLPSHYWRYLALASLLLNIVVNYIYPTLTDGITIAMVSSWYHSLFTPAGFTFSIWGIIYFVFIIYALVQLLPSQKYIGIYDDLAWPFIVANLGGIAWILAFTGNLISLSMVFIFVCLTSAIIMFIKTNKAIRKEQASRWLNFAFSLYAGWITVAAISNVAIWLVSLGWQGSGIGEEPITIALIICAGILACTISRFYQNYMFPLTIAWGLAGIWAINRMEFNSVAITALVTAIVAALYGIIQVYQSFSVVGSRRLNTI